MESFPATFLGMDLSGDYSTLTMYYNMARKLIVFPKAPPDKPPSPAQIVYRTRFKTAIENWKALTKPQQANIEEATLRTSMQMTGLNLWISTSLTGELERYRTVARQANLTLTEPPILATT